MADLWTVAALVLVMACAGALAHRLRVPPALGYLAAGVAATAVVDVHSVIEGPTLDLAGEMGVLFLLFLVGLELDLDRLRRTVRSTAAVLPFDVLAPIAIVGGGARLLGWSVTEALALGMAAALSSTLLGERLTSSGVRPETRRRVLGVLVSEDVAAGVLLAVLAILGGTAAAGNAGVALLATIGQMAFVLVLVAAAALLVVPRILDAAARSHVHELVVLWAVAAVIGFAALGTWAGSAELGAFIAGVAAAEAGSRYVARTALQGIRDTAVALFFFVSGLATDPFELVASPLPAIVVAGLFLATKLAVHIPAGAAGGLPWPEAVRGAFALGTLGEFSLVLAAVATGHGLAHPDLQVAIVGAMLILLPVATFGMAKADRIVAVRRRIPRRLREPLGWAVRALQRLEPQPEEKPGARRAHLRVFLSNLILLLALLLVGAWGAGAAAAAFPDERFAAQAAAWGAAIAVSLPLLRGAYRGYRDLVWSLVGLRPGERVGAGLVRARIVDTVVAASAVVALALLSVSVPATLPVLLAGIVIAAIVAGLTWRRLSSFHDALEASVTRVLGAQGDSTVLLDQILRNYPWGVRSTAVVVPPSSPLARQTVRESRLGAITGATVAVIQRRGQEIVNPQGDERIWPGDALVLMGDAHQLARAEALVVAHGESIRMAAQSRHADLQEVELDEENPWVGRTLAEVDVRGRSGALVAGLWPQGAAHPQPYDGGRVLRVGDRLLVIGSGLQMDRLRRLLADGEPGPAAVKARS